MVYNTMEKCIKCNKQLKEGMGRQITINGPVCMECDNSSQTETLQAKKTGKENLFEDKDQS